MIAMREILVSLNWMKIAVAVGLGALAPLAVPDVAIDDWRVWVAVMMGGLNGLRSLMSDPRRR